MKEFKRSEYTLDIDIYNSLFAYTATKPIKREDLTKLGLSRSGVRGEKLTRREFIKIVDKLVRSGVYSNWLPDSLTIADETLGKSVKVFWDKGHKLSEIPHKYIIGATDSVIISVEDNTVDILKSDMHILVVDNHVLFDTPFKIFDGCHIKNPVLSNCTWLQTITLKDGDTLWIDGDVTITASCPISASGHVSIKGTRGSTLILNNTGEAQPCIGAMTNTGLSYGCWSLATSNCLSILIDQTAVVCTSVVSNFMLGEYGTDNIPKIKCTNGASLDAIEMAGRRYRSVSQVKPLASTRYTDYPVYEIQMDGTAIDILERIKS